MKTRKPYTLSQVQRERKSLLNRERLAAKKLLPLLTADQSRKLFAYDPCTGFLIWKEPRGALRKGTKAGTLRKGYLNVVIDGRSYAVHRVIWLHQTGFWPNGEIDHKDGDRANNRWSNLRDVSVAVNRQNIRGWRPGKKYSPLLGAQWSQKMSRWRSAIYANGKKTHLGYFDSAEEAHAAYVAAKRRLHPGCMI